MDGTIFLNYSGLLYTLLIALCFFCRKKVNNIDTKIYGVLIIVTFLELIFGLVSAYTIYFDNLYIFKSIISRLFLCAILAWIFTFTIYLVNIETSKVKNTKRLNLVLFCLYGVSALLICFLPLNYTCENKVIYTSGMSVNVLYFSAFVYILICMIVGFKNIGKKEKKLIPLWIYMVFGTFCSVIQIFHPELFLVVPLEVFITSVMYHTIENPDMKMVEQLEKAKNEADRAKTDFLSSMSHEIRTPLNAIVGFSDCIVNSNSLTDAKENAKDIVNASKTLLEIVNGILDISKIESGKMELVCISYDSRAAFREVANLLIPKMEEKGLKFSSYIAPDVPVVLYGDVNNVKKIITNLLSNAVKYTDKGFIRYEVSCVNDGDTSRLVISVEDSGRGIKQDAVKNLFSKFQRLDEDKNSTIEGTGLGLAITKQLIDLMGGQIAVHTVYGSGSKFTVMIPQKISTEVIKIESEIEKPKVIQKDIDLAAAKILIVDDNNLNLKVASKLLEKQGASNITCVNSGFDCLDRISMGEKYDLIFMDDMMPKMSGKETFLKLKAIPGFITPVVALTANAISGSKEEYLKVGFSDYLAKPIEKSELTRVLGSVLKEKEEVVSTVTVVDNKELDEKAETKEEYLRRNGVNVDKALELLGDMNMYEVTLKDFLNSIDKKWENIKKYKEEGDLANYSIEVHSLKSDCKYLGFTKLANISFLHELKSKDGDKGYIDRHFSDLENAYNVAIKIMKGV